MSANTLEHYTLTLRGTPQGLNAAMLALECEEVARLTIQYFTQLFQRAEANRASAAGVQDRKILRRDADALGHSIQLQLALGEHHVEVHYNGHVTNLDDEILLARWIAANRFGVSASIDGSSMRLRCTTVVIKR